MLGGNFTKIIEGKTIREIGNKIYEEDILGTSKTFLFCTSEFLQSALT